jgi:Glycosyl transferase family 2
VSLRQRYRRARDRFNKLDWVQFGIFGTLLPLRVRVTHRSPSLGQGPAALLSVMRNAEQWIGQFFDHHRALGVRDFIIADNGSTDSTLAFLRAQQDVTLIETRVPYHAYENPLKRYLVRHFGEDRWCLFVDADELFDWPLRKGRTIEMLTGYLDSTGATAVVCQMVDMFTPHGLERWPRAARPADVCSHYDLSDVRRARYPFWRTNGPHVPGVAMHWGGIRARLFGSANGLTKVSLFKGGHRLKPFDQWHHVRHARIADVTCALYHYPFIPCFADKVREAEESWRFGHVANDEYRAYAEALQRGQPDFRTPGATRASGTDALLDEGFLVTSPRFRRWMD